MSAVFMWALLEGLVRISELDRAIEDAREDQ